MRIVNDISTRNNAIENSFVGLIDSELTRIQTNRFPTTTIPTTTNRTNNIDRSRNTPRRSTEYRPQPINLNSSGVQTRNELRNEIRNEINSGTDDCI